MAYNHQIWSLSIRESTIQVGMLLLLHFAAIGCSFESRPLSSVTYRDSAGVQIVNNLSRAWRDGEEWWVDPDPVFDLSGRDDEELFAIGIPQVLPDGRLLIFNGATCQLRFYDEEASLLGVSGRCGSGPGEYRGVSFINSWRGDSLVVFDPRLRRLTFLDVYGEFGRTEILQAHADMPRPNVVGLLNDGSFVLSGQRDPGGRDAGVVEAAQRTLGLHRPNDDVQVIGIYPGAIWQYVEVQGTVGRHILSFSGSTKVAVRPDRLVLGSPERYEIRLLKPDGGLDRVIRRPFDPVQVSEADIDWLLERRLREVEGDENQRMVRQAFRGLEYAETMPAFGIPVWTSGFEPGGPDILCDAEGNLWTFDYYRPGEYRNRFSVFSTDGLWLGTVTFPALFRPSQIGTDFVVGTWADEIGFVHARRFRLIKPPSGS